MSAVAPADRAGLPADVSTSTEPEDGATPPGRRGRLRLATGPRWPARAVLVLTWVVVAIGTALRVRQWAHGRAFGSTSCCCSGR